MQHSRRSRSAIGTLGACTVVAGAVEPTARPFILPLQVRTMLGAVLANDPWPFYMHQSNLTGDRLGYALMNSVLSGYRSVYAGNTPIVKQRLSADGAALNAQAIWAQGRLGAAILKAVG